MKRLIRKIINILGYDLVKKKRPGQNSSTRSSSLTLYTTATGKYFLPTDAQGDVVAIAIKNDRIFDSEIVETARKWIKPQSVVLDVGSNFGQMCLLFSEMVGNDGVVYAFDADDFVFDILKKNIQINGKENKIIPIFGAVYNKVDEILFFPEQDFTEFSSYGSYGIDFKNKKGRKVPSVTIDSLNIQKPISFMKVDVQGGDLQAMQGAIETIRKNQMPILFEYEYLFEERLDLSFQEYIDFVASINYRFLKVINGQNFLIVPK